MERIYKNKIFKILLAMYSFISVCYQMSLFKTSIQYSSLLLLLFAFILYLYLKNDYLLNKREKKYITILSIFISLFLIIGKQVFTYIYVNNVYLFDLKTLIISLVMGLGLYILFYNIFTFLFHNLDKINIYEKNNKKTKMIKYFWVYFIIIFICYIPYFLRCYPIMLSTDSFVQIKTVEQGIFSDWHPFVETWFFGGIYNLGKIIFGTNIKALAFYTIIQMLLTALVFAYALYLLYKNNIKKEIRICILLFLALSPLYGYYSVTLWKDILFGINFVLIIIALLKLQNAINVKNIIFFVFTILILFFFRNNGIYIFLFMIPFLIKYFKNYRKLFSILCICLVAFYYLIKGPVYNLIGVQKTSSTEAYSIPLEQIGRTITLNGNMSSEDKEYLMSILDYDKVSEKYQPHLADNMKNLVNVNKFNNSKKEFYKTYLSLMVKNPRIYIDAYLSSTLGYWYPDTINYTTSTINAETEDYNGYAYDIKSEPKITGKLGSLMDSEYSKGYPFSNVFWSVGLYCNLLFVLFAIALYKRKNNNNVICYIPFIGLWLTMMIATPVFCELRYVYGLFTCMPFLIILPFEGSKINERKK